MALALTGTAVAAPGIGKDGKVHACYRFKGKAKGAMRVVPAHKRCRRGERKLAWSISGPSGEAGSAGGQGAQGGAGSGGSSGANGSSGASTAALETKIAALNLKVETLEGVLKGVTNLGLTNAIAAVPAVNALCTQTSALTTRANSLLDSLGTTVLGGTIPLGLTLTVPNLPATPLSDFTAC